jgi:hypothetical protein
MDDRPPCVGAEPTANVNDALSTSVADNVISFAVSSAVVWLCGVPAGASFTAVIVRLTVAGLEFDVPSFVTNVKLSGPL